MSRLITPTQYPAGHPPTRCSSVVLDYDRSNRINPESLLVPSNKLHEHSILVCPDWSERPLFIIANE